MNTIADFLFEIKTLKELPRAGYFFLGSGGESVAEHSFMTAVIALTMSRMDPGIDRGKLVAMALVHDFAEARTGDLNYVQQRYVTVREDEAARDMVQGLEFGDELTALLEEFNQGETREARLANDADQLSFVMELKKARDTGAKDPGKWLGFVMDRLKTDLGRQFGESLLSTTWDNWWQKNYSE